MSIAVPGAGVHTARLLDARQMLGKVWCAAGRWAIPGEGLLYILFPGKNAVQWPAHGASDARRRKKYRAPPEGTVT